MKKKTLFKATSVYDEKVAKSFRKTEYYEAQAKNEKMYDFLQKEKIKLSTPRSEVINDFLKYYKAKATQWESPAGKIMLGIYNKNKAAALRNSDITSENLIGLVSKPEMLLLAYKAIKSNKGALTKGSFKTHKEIKNMTEDQKAVYDHSNIFPNGFSLHHVEVVSELFHKGQYPCGTSKRVYFPKPGVKDKMRPITIPPFLHRVVQKAICMVFEAIYEPHFEVLNRSYGFRSNKSVHDAITSLTSLSTTGMRVAVEGDVEAAYDTVDKKILLNILSKKIKHNKFLKLIEQRLQYDYVETKDGKTIRNRPTLGIPQGGINSPYLFTIYINELDQYVEQDLKDLLNQMNKNMENKQKEKMLNNIPKNTDINLHNQIRSQKRQMRWVKEEIHKTIDQDKLSALRKQLYGHIKQIHLRKHKKNKKSSRIQTQKSLRLFYVRYADD